MAHPYAKHNDHAKSHARVAHILKDEPADQQRHDGKAYSHTVRSKSAAVAHEHKVGGHKQPGRFARGGKVGHKKGGHHTNIAVVVPQSKSPPAAGPQAGAGAPPPMPAPAPPGGPGGPPPMMGPGGPGGPPPGPPGMSKRGGRIHRKHGGKVPGGEPTKGNLDAWSAHASKHSYARGGGLPSAGAMSGEGRLQKAKKA